jgi:protein gp37
MGVSVENEDWVRRIDDLRATRLDVPPDVFLFTARPLRA